MAEPASNVGKLDAILRPPRPSDARVDRRKIQLERLREFRLALVLAPEALLFCIALYKIDLLAAAAGLAQVRQRLLIDGENADGRAIFGGHVGNDGGVGERPVA